MSLLTLISAKNYITVNKSISRKIGLQASVFFSELVYKFEYWADRHELLDDKWFFFTVEDAEEATTLKRDAQLSAIKILTQHNLIECTRKGIPSKRYFALNIDEIYQFVLDVRVDDNKNAEKPTTDSGAGSDALKCSEKPEKPRHYQMSENPTTGQRKSRHLENGKTDTTINQLLLINKNKDDDDDINALRAELESEFVSNGLMTIKTFNQTIERIAKKDVSEISDIKSYIRTSLNKAVKTEQAKAAKAAAKEATPEVKKVKQPSLRKAAPKGRGYIHQPAEQKYEPVVLTDEQVQKALELARRLDASRNTASHVPSQQKKQALSDSELEELMNVAKELDGESE